MNYCYCDFYIVADGRSICYYYGSCCYCYNSADFCAKKLEILTNEMKFF